MTITLVIRSTNTQNVLSCSTFTQLTPYLQCTKSPLYFVHSLLLQKTKFEAFDDKTFSIMHTAAFNIEFQSTCFAIHIHYSLVIHSPSQYSHKSLSYPSCTWSRSTLRLLSQYLKIQSTQLKNIFLNSVFKASNELQLLVFFHF